MQKIIILIYLSLLIVSCSKSDQELKYTIRKGKFDASLIESGELQAVNTNVIVIPGINWRYANQLKLTSLIEHGSKVKKGDIIAEIDKSSLMKTLFDHQSRLEVEETALDKMLIQQSTTAEQIKTEILAQEATYSLAKLQLEKFKFESDKKQKIKTLEFEKATIALQKAKDRQKANDITSQKSIYIQKVKIQQTKNTIKDIERNLKYFTIHSPFDGMVEIRHNFETNQMLKVGDRIWPGYPIAAIPDLSIMKVSAKINETDIGKLKLWQLAHIRLQAFPKQTFNGKITRIFPICYSPEKDSKVKVFDFEILLDKSDHVLKPGMSVSCEVFFAQYEKVTYIENECIVRSDSASYIVLEKNREYKPVRLGASNNKFTIIDGDIKEGDKAIPLHSLQTSLNP
jgi:HlyD family secretion protein